MTRNAKTGGSFKRRETKRDSPDREKKTNQEVPKRTRPIPGKAEILRKQLLVRRKLMVQPIKKIRGTDSECCKVTMKAPKLR